MAEVASIISARPLVPVPTDPDELFFLTPAVFLTKKVNSAPAAPAGELQTFTSASGGKFNTFPTHSGTDAIPTNSTGTQKNADHEVLSSSRTANYHRMNGLLDW